MKEITYIIIEFAIMAYMLSTLIFFEYRSIGFMLLLTLIALFILFRIGWLMYEEDENNGKKYK